MPNISIDYTPNALDQAAVDALVAALHQAALDLAVFPTWGIRTMAQPATAFRVARGDAGMGFVQVMVRIAPGRDLALRQRIAKALFDAASQVLDPLFARQPLGLQLEVQEFDASVTLNRNTLDV
jgi:5-carboxymethyl-2-hydroxymuconate isomerase